MPDALGHLLLSLPALIDEAREIGLPVVLERTSPLPAHAQRLMDTLGVEVRVVTQSPAQLARQGRLSGRGMGHYIPIPGSSNGLEPRADWIDFRASRGRVFKRRDAGETVRICDGCETEIDVDDVVHSPKCPAFLGEQPKTKAADWDANAVITAIRLWAGEHDGEAPSSEQWRVAINGYPSYAIVVQLFGSWNDGIAAAGFEPRASHRERLDEREPEADGAGMRPAVSPADSDAEPASRSSSRAPSVATSEGVRQRTKWTADTVLVALREWALAHGRPPKTTDAQKRGSGLPDPAYASKFFGGWRQAIAATEAEGVSLGAAAMPQTAMPVPASELLATPPQPSEAAEQVLDSPPQDEVEEPQEAEAPPDRDVLGLTAAQLIVAGRLMEAIADTLVVITKAERRVVWAVVEPLVSEVLDA